MDVPHGGRPDPSAMGQPQEPDDLTAKVIELQEDNDRLQTAITSHAVIDQAIGVVIALSGLSPHQGFDILRDVSQHTNIKLREIATLIIDWVRTQQLPDEVQQAFDTALARARFAAARSNDEPAPTRQ